MLSHEDSRRQQEITFRLADAVAILERTPATLRAWLGVLPEPWVMNDEGPDTFSAFEVVGHLIHAERTDWIVRARVILAQGPDRRFPPFDRFGHRAESRGRSMSQLLDDFARERASSLSILEEWQLTDRQLELEGEHPELGPVTLRQLLATWVAHDLSHIAQIARVMAKQYRTEVGPWRAFLPIMDR